MNEAEKQENWQVQVGGQIYEAQFGELEQWVHEGSLLRSDSVRRGSLRWIEAGKVPSLIKFFNAKDQGITPVFAAKTETPPDSVNYNAPISNAAETSPNYNNPPQNFAPDNVSQQSSTEHCALHTDAPPFYFCETCQNNFCKQCPKSYGGNVKICPMCGAMCRSLKESNAEQQRNTRYQNDISSKFGLEDFGKALVYPFKFKASLIFGAIFFVFFSFGQSGASFGGGVMMFAALICVLGTNMLSFGILSNTLENFSHGRIDADFMPNFDTFSMWDDVLHPFILSIGVYLISFGLFAAIAIGGAWFAFNQISHAANAAAMQQAARINQIKQQQTIAAENNQPEAMTAESVGKSHDADNEKIQKLLAEAQKNNSANDNDDEFDAPAAPSPAAIFQSLTKFALPFALALLISLVWGIFYFPAACAVAGYTRSFAAVMNLSVGFDTIKRLGADYFKILAMVILLMFIAGTFLGFTQIMLKPFDVPMMGNIPVKIISGVLTFYISIVFACILGFALYKNSDKLELLKK